MHESIAVYSNPVVGLLLLLICVTGGAAKQLQMTHDKKMAATTNMADCFRSAIVVHYTELSISLGTSNLEASKIQIGYVFSGLMAE